MASGEEISLGNIRSLHSVSAYNVMSHAEFESNEFKPSFFGKTDPRNGGNCKIEFERADFVELPKFLSSDPQNEAV